MDWTLDQFRTYQSIASDNPDGMESKDNAIYEQLITDETSYRGNPNASTECDNDYQLPSCLEEGLPYIEIPALSPDWPDNFTYENCSKKYLSNQNLQEDSTIDGKEGEYHNDCKNENDLIKIKQDNWFSQKNTHDEQEIQTEEISFENLKIQDFDDTSVVKPYYNFTQDMKNEDNVKFPVIQSTNDDGTDDTDTNTSTPNTCHRNAFKKSVHFSLQTNSVSNVYQLKEDIKHGIPQRPKSEKLPDLTTNFLPKLQLQSKKVYDKTKIDLKNNLKYKRKCNMQSNAAKTKSDKHLDFPIGKEFITKKISQGVWISHHGIPLRVFLRYDKTKEETERKQVLEEKKEVSTDFKTLANVSLWSVKLSKSDSHTKTKTKKKNDQHFHKLAKTSLISVRLSKTLKQSKSSK